MCAGRAGRRVLREDGAAASGTDRRRARAERTRRRLLRAARRLFATRGYDATRVELVAERAGITRVALYYHFRDKCTLFRAVCEEVEGECIEEIAHAVARVPDFWDKVEAATQATLDAFLDPAYVQIVFRDGPGVLGWEEWHEIVGRFGRHQLRTGLEAAMDEGQISRSSAAWCCARAIGTSDGFSPPTGSVSPRRALNCA